MQITDRSKDVIKLAGNGSHRSSFENLAAGHPKVGEAAVIGVKHSKWGERPLLIAVPKKGQAILKEEILSFMRGKVADWWLPDDVVFVTEIPHTATGKILKTVLREQYRDVLLPATTAH
jgi:fatty-acyl-CoA synthase